jgi:hypothetical protein
MEFLGRYRALGFPDKSSLVREALEHFERALVRQQLAASANLYSEEYSGDKDLQALTEQASQEWPE